MYKLVDKNGIEQGRSNAPIEYNPVNPGWHLNDSTFIVIDVNKEMTVEEFTPEETE